MVFFGEVVSVVSLAVWSISLVWVAVWIVDGHLNMQIYLYTGFGVNSLRSMMVRWDDE